MAEEVAKAFISHFYTNMMHDRMKNIPLYRENSYMSYNGSNHQGVASINEKLSNLSFKTIAFQYQDLDIQPVHGDGLLITVNGKLNMDNENTFSFCQIFVLMRDASSYYIQNDIFRLIY